MELTGSKNRETAFIKSTDQSRDDNLALPERSVLMNATIVDKCVRYRIKMIFCANYSKTLANLDAQRYADKVYLCNGHDPYEMELNTFNEAHEGLPSVTREDLIEYLVLTTDTYSMKQLKAYKGLEAHNFLTSGWVQFIRHKEISSEKVLVVAKVTHSQSLNLPPLKVWVFCRTAGDVITAHCVCMAGLGAVCSHVGAILFALEFAMEQRNASCTSRDNAWLPPNVKEVPIAEVGQCDFTSAERKYKIMSGEITSNATKKTLSVNSDWELSQNDFLDFLHAVDDTDSRAAVLKVVSPFCEARIPICPQKPDPVCLPKPLSQLFDTTACNLSFEDLLVKCNAIFTSLTITEAEAVQFEAKTRQQATSPVWFEQRAGRITASNMREVCHIKAETPSVSLLKKNCYPLQNTFSTAATRRGKKLEKPVIQDYSAFMSSKHEDFHFWDAGFFIKPELPHIGASPDAIVQCLCHGVGIVEVKCPTEDKENNTGLSKSTLNKNHKFFYQIQTRLLVSNVAYCDFVLLLPDGTYHIERIYKDEQKQQDIIDMATIFFKKAVLPELVAKFFSSQKHPLLPLKSQNNVSQNQQICSCRSPPAAPMIICYNPSCSIVTFHWKCVGVRKQRKRWLCSNCDKKE